MSPARRAEEAALAMHLQAVEQWCHMTDGVDAWPAPTTTGALEAQARIKITARAWWKAKRDREAAERA